MHTVGDSAEILDITDPLSNKCVDGKMICQIEV